MSKWPSLLFLALFFCGQATAGLKDFTIDANHISYQKEKYLLEADGSVEAVYKDSILHGRHLLYNTSTEVVTVSGGFNLHYDAITIEGETLDYKILSQEGNASNIFLTYNGFALKGDYLEFAGRTKFLLKNASFTTCDYTVPHYRVTAADIQLYPEQRWLVAYWGWFWLDGVPVVPLPTYIYDLSVTSKSKKNLPPFPQVGSNDLDGAYISETMVWHLNRFLSGTYTLSYATKSGLGGGGEADYYINETNRGNLRAYADARQGSYGGLTHYYRFGDVAKPPVQSQFDFLPQEKLYKYELETLVSFREKINYQRVSFTPNFKLTLQDDLPISYRGDISLGLVAEEGTTRLKRGGLNWQFSRDIFLNGLGIISPNVIWNSAFYSNGTRWLYPTVGLLLKKEVNHNLAWNLGYDHYWLTEGTSPFNYELYRFRAADRIKPGLSFILGDMKGKIMTSYYLDNGSPEDIDYSLFFAMHCYNLEVTYRAMRNEFSLSFGLGGGQT